MIYASWVVVNSCTSLYGRSRTGRLQIGQFLIGGRCSCSRLLSERLLPAETPPVTGPDDGVSVTHPSVLHASVILPDDRYTRFVVPFQNLRLIVLLTAAGRPLSPDRGASGRNCSRRPTFVQTDAVVGIIFGRRGLERRW